MYNILYVDDEPDLLEIAKIYLERTKEFVVTTHVSARQGLESCEADPYDAIISDYQMPVMDGIDLLKEVRLRFGDIPFILFTGKGREAVVIEAINNGADFYIQKGGDPRPQFAELAHKVRQAIKRKSAEQALKLSEMKYRSLVEASPDMIWEIDTAGKFTYISPKSSRFLGYSPEELIGKSVYSLIPGGDIPVVEAIFKQHLESNDDIFSLEVNALHKEGHLLVIEVRSTPWRNENAKIIGFRGIARDTTGIKKAKKETARAKKDWETIFRAIGNPVVIMDTDHSIIDANEAVLALTKKSIDQIRTMKCWQLFHSPVATEPPEGCPMEKMLHSGTLETVVMEMNAFNGVYLVSCTPVFDDSGRLEKVIHIATDVSENKRMQNAIRESEEKYRSIFENAVLGIFRTPPAGAYIDINPAFAHICGYKSPDEMKDAIRGREKGLFVRQPDCEKIFEELDRGHSVEYYETEFYRGDGSRIWVRINAKPVPDPEGRVLFYEGTAEDITAGKKAGVELQAAYEQLAAADEELKGQLDELKRSEDELRLSEERYRLLLQNVNDAVYVHEVSENAPGQILEVNDIACSMLGYARDEMIGMSVDAIDVPEQAHRLPKILDEIFRTGHSIFETEHRAKDGRHIPVEVSTRFFRIRGRPTILSTARDITARKEAQRRLKESEEWFRDIISNTPDIVWETDENGYFTYISPPVTDILGYLPEEITGHTPFEFMDQNDAEIARNAFLESGSSKFLNLSHPSSWKHRDGHTVILESRACPFFSPDGHFRGFRGIDRDITHSVRNQEALKQANQKFTLLQEITRHDILNKISVLIGNLEIARHTSSDPQIISLIDRLDSVGHSIKEIIEFTRDYQEIGIAEPNWQSPGDIIASLVIPESIAVSVDLDGLVFYADPMLSKVFDNLVDNSVRHGGHVATISVSFAESPEGLILSFKDDGSGIPYDEKEIIFERGHGKNTGLGLFLVREILSITGILIRETGEPGRGARFELVIPAGAYRFRNGI